ncbi:MAG: septum formation initiator family protein [Caulobacteraceae bacterium]|nr:septum formation initiator family protein [Caulobacteraceae bacterium]
MFTRARPYIPTAVFALLILYFSFHALTGDRGMLTGAVRDRVLADRAARLEQLRAERRELETRVKLLRTSHLSRDLLEERARVLLGYSDPRDYVIRVQDLRPTRS